MLGPQDEVFTLKDIHLMCQNIIQQFSHKSELLQIQGLLRLAGAKPNTLKIYHSKSIPPIDRENVHSVLDVYKKYYSKLEEFIDLDERGVAKLREVATQLTDKPKSKLKTAKALNEFIDTYAMSLNSNQAKIAEILYGYFYLASLICTHSKQNKMDALNCAIVIGPKLEAVLKLLPVNTDDPLDYYAQIDKLKDVIQFCIESGEYAISFREKYHQLRKKAKHQQYKKLGHSIRELEGKILKIKERIEEYEKKRHLEEVALIELRKQKDRLPKKKLFKSQSQQQKNFSEQNDELTIRKQALKQDYEERLGALQETLTHCETLLLEQKRERKHLRRYKKLKSKSSDVDYVGASAQVMTPMLEYRSEGEPMERVTSPNRAQSSLRP